MADNIIWSTIYLGNFADFDTDETTRTVEDASALLTTFGEGAGNALANNIVDVTTFSGDDVLNTDNEGTPNYMSYDLGSGIQSPELDSVVLLDGTVTFYDGSTFSGSFGVMQADNGDTFLLVRDSLPELASQGIDTITFTSVLDSNYAGIGQYNVDDHDFVCFGPGTKIATPLGAKRADKLKVGDIVVTLDNGPLPIRWIGKRRLIFDTPHLAQPVRIARGAFGDGLPERDLILSPNHRVLVDTAPSHALHDPLGALAPVKALTRLRGIRYAAGWRAITYFSFLLPGHAVLIAEGIAAESLYPGPGTWASLTGPERSDWLRLAGQSRVTGVPPARLLLSTAEARAGVEAGAFSLPSSRPKPAGWTARTRRAPALPVHLAPALATGRSRAR